MNRKLISVVSGCYNEEQNLPEFASRLTGVAARFIEYDWEFIIIDNCSTDNSERALAEIAAADRRFKVIFNIRNFGQIRSPFHAIMQASGDAVVCLSSDLQDPPELISEFIAKWRDGSPIVAAVRVGTKANILFNVLRSTYYKIIKRVSDVELIENFTGFGLYSREVILGCRAIKDPYPYFRGMISELGYPVVRIPFFQPSRTRGISSNNLYSLFDYAMLGFTSHTKIPLRLATMVGFGMSILCFLAGMFYFLGKLIFWDSFAVGIAPLVVGLFFIGSIQLFFIGVIGEYVGSIHTKVSSRPLVVERKRLNF
jgi:glycosyltransferase involved in cell wall biosynthesis